jgi:hypothetical protein
MSYREFDSIDAFVRAVQDAGGPRVVLAWQREYGPRLGAPDAPFRPDYGQVRIVTLLAYSGGSILRCRLDDAERLAVRRRLDEAGLQVDERCRNLTSPVGKG